MDNPKTPNLFEQPNKAPLTQPPPESWVDKLVDRLQRIEEAHAKQVLDFSRLVDVLTDRQALSASRTYNIPANLSVIFEAMNGDFVLFSSSSPGPTLAITPTNLRIATPFTFASTQNFLLVPTPGGGSVSIQNTGTSSVSVTAQSLSLAQATAIAQSVGASGIQIAQLTGSLAPLTAAAPKLIGTVPYTSFTASGTIYPSFKSVLSRNARRRTFYLYNTLNESLSSAGYIPQDSALAPAGVSVAHSEAASVIPAASQIVIDTSEQLPLLAAHVDSMALSLGMGATLPTSGAVYLYVTEVL